MKAATASTLLTAPPFILIFFFLFPFNPFYPPSFLPHSPPPSSPNICHVWNCYTFLLSVHSHSSGLPLYLSHFYLHQACSLTLKTNPAYISEKKLYLSTKLCDIMSQKTEIVTNMKTSNLTSNQYHHNTLTAISAKYIKKHTKSSQIQHCKYQQIKWLQKNFHKYNNLCTYNMCVRVCFFLGGGG